MNPEIDAIKVVIENDTLICSVPLINSEKDLSKAKIVAYGALKLAEEQVSIYFMRVQAMRMQQVRTNQIIKPGLAH